MRHLTDGDRDVLAECERDARLAFDAAEYDAAFPRTDPTDADLDAMYGEWQARYPDADPDEGGTDEFPW
jgi:hypothetical protein